MINGRQTVENSIEENIEELKRLLYRNELTQYGKRKLINYYEQQEKDYKKVLKEVKRYKNMYEAEHQIHLVRNEQLDRKQKAIIKCNELENENKELKKENEELKHKIEGQECVIETQAHNEAVYERTFARLEKENKELKEYISIAPNLDEMTAVKYRNIQRNAYIRGRAEEQQRAEQIIYENYIPVQKVKEVIKELEENIYRIKKQYSNGGENCNTAYLENLAQVKILKQMLKESEE